VIKNKMKSYSSKRHKKILNKKQINKKMPMKIRKKMLAKTKISNKKNKMQPITNRIPIRT